MEKLLIFHQTEEDQDVSEILNEEIGCGIPLIHYVKINLKSNDKQFKGGEGEAAGYILSNLHMWPANEEPLFFSLDGYSQLLYHLHLVLFERSHLRNTLRYSSKKNKEDMNGFFLNRIYCKENTVENHEYFLKAMQDTYDFIIYSFGSIELGDDDFPDDFPDELIEAVEEKTLTVNNGWIKDEMTGLYIWKKQ